MHRDSSGCQQGYQQPVNSLGRGCQQLREPWAAFRGGIGAEAVAVAGRGEGQPRSLISQMVIIRAMKGAKTAVVIKVACR